TWQRQARLFAEMLVDMRWQFAGARAFTRMFQNLLDDVPSGPSFHNMDRYNFAKLLAEMSMDMELTRRNTTSWGIAATELFEDVEQALVDRLGDFAHSVGSSLAVPLRLQEEREDDSGEMIPVPDAGKRDAVVLRQPHHMLFVNMPLGVYVRNSPHLYEMLSRLRHLREGTGVESVHQMLAVLDEGGHCYSVLVYAIMAAMQLLFQVARVRTAAAWKLRELWPLNGSTLDSSSCLFCERLMFRGIWVPREVDEVAARLQHSFNSFSREADGVRKVLRFYARSQGTKIAALAQQEQHVLILVARRCPQQEDWAFPMQFFSWHESREGVLERELVLPPFVAYEFESDLELCSAMSALVRAEKVAALEDRWGLPPKFFASEVPKLLRWLADPRSMLLHDLLGSPPCITVRFVRGIALADPVRTLLETSDPNVPCLLEFPPCWRVVGGEQTGGLLVRQGPGLDSALFPERLEHGALIAEVDVQGARMQYRKLLGGGPPQGWITKFVQQSSKLLIVREH
ncbi:unnamed protein product, partial [Symbiodinium natans]